MSVPITYRQKMDFSFCVYMVGFPKYGHIYDSIVVLPNCNAITLGFWVTVLLLIF